LNDHGMTEQLGPTPPGFRRVLPSCLRITLILGGTGLAAATLMPLFHPLWPMSSVAEHFALQILLAAGVLLVLALALRRWRWLAVILVIALIQVWIIHPYWPRLAQATASGQQDTLKIVSLNVRYSSDSFGAVRDYLAASNADVIGLVEITPLWKAELAPLRTLYPYSVDCVGTELRCEEMLLSKHPFLQSGAGWVNQDLPVLAWAEIAPRHGTGPPLTIAVTHLAWPFLGARPAATPAARNQPIHPDTVPHIAQSEQAENLLGGLRQLGDNLILMGDFNAAPWSRVQQHLRAETGLDNQGFVAPSWPAWGPGFIRLPIDHIMARGAARVISFGAGPDVGSDHLPVEAVVSLMR
jgi:endonuclease/exonuclease/phosphatase (EEP) superfamily protein YafD